MAVNETNVFGKRYGTRGVQLIGFVNRNLNLVPYNITNFVLLQIQHLGQPLEMLKARTRIRNNRNRKDGQQLVDTAMGRCPKVLGRSDLLENRNVIVVRRQ